MQLKSSKYSLLNGEFHPAATASLGIKDLAIQRGYGIFDFFKSIDGKFLFIEDHLDRLYFSAAQMHLPLKHSREELKALLQSLMEKNELPDSGMRITLTGGYAEDGYTLAQPNIIITQQAFMNPEFDPQGLRLITHPHQRQLAEVKTIDYLMAIRLQPMIKQQGADDVLYHDQGMSRECPRSNFFMVNHQNEVMTSATGVLKGVIRKHVLNFKIDGLTLVERDFSLNELRQCKEAFVTSSTKNVMPVSSIDGQKIGTGQAGEVTRALAATFTTLITQLND
jgi:branched-chain amino acid aminotransferase